MAVLLGVDPVQARYQLGLDREDDWHKPLDRLSSLSPDWVELVSELHALIRQRPPRCFT